MHHCWPRGNLRSPSAVAVTAALLGLATASYPLYLASSASGALAVEVAQRCPDGLDAAVTGAGPVSGIQGATDALGRSRTQRSSLRARAGTIFRLPSSRSTPRGRCTPRGAVDLQTVVQSVSRTERSDNITVLSSVGGPGSGCPTTSPRPSGPRREARSLGQDVEAQQPSRVRGRRPPTSGSSGSTPAWSEPCSPVLVHTETRSSDLRRRLPASACRYRSTGHPDLDARLDQGHEITSYQWERTLSVGINVPEAQKIVTAIEHFSRSIGVVLPIREGFVEPPIGGGVRGPLVDNQLVFIVAHAPAIEHALRSGILPVSVAGMAVSALLVAVAGSYWVDRRRLEVHCFLREGPARPARCKGSTREFDPGCRRGAGGMGGGLGAGCSDRTERVDTCHVEPRRTMGSLAGAAVRSPFGRLVAGLRVRSGAIQRLGRGRLARVPFELVRLGISMWAWSTLGQPSLPADGASAPGVGAAFLAFPILFLLSLACSGSAARSDDPVRAPFQEGDRGAGRPGWLASRRLSGAPRIAALCLASTAAAVGVLIYASALTSSQNATIHAKAAVFVGSTTSVQLGAPGPVPVALASSSTEVLSFADAELDGQAVDVFGVDPETFARAAFWDWSFSEQLATDAGRRSRQPGSCGRTSARDSRGNRWGAEKVALGSLHLPDLRGLHSFRSP